MGDLIWSATVLFFGLGIFTSVVDGTFLLGKTAMERHQKGLVNLVELNCSLMGDKLPKQCAKYLKKKR